MAKNFWPLSSRGNEPPQLWRSTEWHARTDLVKEIVLGIGRSKEGVRFENSLEPAHLIFVIGVPRQMIQDYLVCVGALARLTRDDSIRTGLLEMKTRTEFVERLRSASLLLE